MNKLQLWIYRVKKLSSLKFYMKAANLKGSDFKFCFLVYDINPK